MCAYNDRGSTYDRIRHMIVSGRLAPGSRLIEQEIAEHLGVSRTPVREAISRLQREGYFCPTRGRKRKRVRVAPLTRSDARQLLPIVGALESLAAKWLLREVDGDSRSSAVERLASLNDEIDDRSRDEPLERSELLELDRQFHGVLVQAADAPRFLKEHRSLKPQTERYARMYIRLLAEEVDSSVSEHAKVVAALQSGSVEEAVAAVRQHWKNALRRLERAITEKGEIGEWRTDASADTRVEAF